MTERRKLEMRRAVLWLSVLAVALVVAAVAALVSYTWQELDQSEARQETLLVQRKVERNLMRLRQEATSATSWDEAYERTAGPMDADWIDDKLAAYYHLSFEHDITLLFDARGRLQYASRDGDRARLSDEAGLANAVSPTVRRVQSGELTRRSDPAPLGRDEVRRLAQRSIVVAGDGRAYLVAVATILPTHNRARGADPATVVVTGWLLDDQLLAAMADDVGVDDLTFSARISSPHGRGQVLLRAPDGSRVGVLTWRLGRPGAEAVRDIARPMAAGALLLALVFALLGRQIARLLAELRERDRALRDSLAAETEARGAAQAASEAKSAFIANISHEIRTPLNGVLGMAQVLALEELSASQRDRVDTILTSGRGLLTLLNSVLDLSKIEADRLDLVEATFDLDALLEDVRRTYAAVSAAKGLDLQIASAPGGLWEGDEGRIRQILLNLVANAVKFTDTGRVVIRGVASEAGLAISVADDGVGIAPDKLPALFEAFSQVDTSRTRRHEGAGLGLAISRRLARLMGGDIRAESTAGLGSVFTLTLPLAPVPASDVPPAPAAATDVTGLRVLAADDNAVNRTVLEALLTTIGAEVAAATNGAEAVALYRTQAFDIVLMDIQMPVMDGLAAVAEIRRMEAAERRPRTPIIALTANALSHQVAAYLAAGMDGHVPKPLDAGVLFAAIAGAFDADGGRTEAA